MWFRCAVGESSNWTVRGTRSCTDLTDLEDPAPSHSHDTLKVPVVQGKFEERNVLVWRLPINISQSRLAGRQRTSNACTIISLKVIEFLHEGGVLFPSVRLDNDVEQPSLSLSASILQRVWPQKAFITTEFPCPGRLMNCLANAIIEGNEIYERVVVTFTTSRRNFTIPEALGAVRNSFHEMDFCSIRGSLFHNLPFFLTAAINSETLSDHNCLYFLLIVVERCVVIVYQRVDKLIGFLDSHLHPPGGAIIACTTLANLNVFCRWMEQHVFVDGGLLDPSLQVTYQINSKNHGNRESFELSSICHFDGILARSDGGLPPVLRRHFVFPTPQFGQVVLREVRVCAHQMIVERRRCRDGRRPPYSLTNGSERRHKRGLTRGAKYSTSLPMLL